MAIRRCDVLVAGCGPVGAMLAARLGAHGLDVVVVDPAREVHPLPRAVAADDEVQALLDATAPGLLDGAVRDVGVRFLDAAGRELGSLRFPAGSGGHPGLTLFSQPDLERRLRPLVHAVADVRPGVGLQAWAQDATGVSAVLSNGEQVRACWLIGCDGAGSLVRRTAGIGWLGRDLARWLVVDVAGEVGAGEAEGTDGPRLTYTLDPRRPQVDMPIPGGHRWEWRLGEREPVPDSQTLLPPGVDPARVQRAAPYRYGAFRATRWRAGRVLLAGDAAHTMPPFAGQGLGAGIRDAVLLADLLATGGDPPRLDSYEQRRAPHVREMTRLSLLLGGLVEARHASTARNLLLHSAFRAPAVGPWLRRGGPRRSASGVLPLGGR